MRRFCVLCAWHPSTDTADGLTPMWAIGMTVAAKVRVMVIRAAIIRHRFPAGLNHHAIALLEPFRVNGDAIGSGLRRAWAGLGR